ncbi:alpha/beta fold hydrolase [Bacteroidota bacterium]
MKKVLIYVFVILFLGCQNSSDNPEKKVIQKLVSGYVQAGESQLFYNMQGEGKPLIMIHGGLLNMSMWDSQWREFAQKYKLIRYDAKGHGQSKNLDKSFSHHEDLYQLINSLKLDKPVIMGLSMGGHVAIDFALKYPDIASALILVSPGLTGFVFDSKELKNYQDKLVKAAMAGDKRGVIEYFQRSWTDGPYRIPRDVDPVVREKVRAMIEETYTNWNDNSVENKLSPEAINRLKEINIPVLVITGSLDLPDIHKIAELLKKDVKGLQHIEIPGVAHMVNMENPQMFNKIVHDFMQKLK